MLSLATGVAPSKDQDPQKLLKQQSRVGEKDYFIIINLIVAEAYDISSSAQDWVKKKRYRARPITFFPRLYITKGFMMIFFLRVHLLF